MGIQSILVDQREPEWIRQLQFGGVPICVTLLDAGDLLVATDDACLLAIERKTATDFLNTLREDRLFSQIARLRDWSPWAYLVICGGLQPGLEAKTIASQRPTGWAWASVQGALLTVQELGVAVVQVVADTDYEAVILRLGNRKRESVRVASARDASVITETEAVLASLPGIGPEKSRLLLETLGTVHQALRYLTVFERDWEGLSIPGIGDGTRRRVRHALGLDDDWYLAAHPMQRF